MRADKKIERQLEQHLALLQSMGADISELKVDTKQVVAEVILDKKKLPPYWDAEATLWMLCKPEGFVTKKCRRDGCENIFATSYKSVAYCTDHCRIKQLEAYGLQWDPTKSPEERWSGEPPLIVPDNVLRIVAQLLASMHAVDSDNQTQLETEVADETSHDPEPTTYKEDTESLFGRVAGFSPF